MDASEITQILIRTPHWIGDHIMALSFYQQVRRLFPGAQIDAWAPSSVAALGHLDLFDHVYGFDYRERRKKTEMLLTLPTHQKWSLGINLPLSLSSTQILKAAPTRFRFGWSVWGASFFLTHGVTWPGRSRGLHKSKMYEQMAAPIAETFGLLEKLSDPPPSSTQPTPLPGSGPPQIVLAPGASIALRQWPYFAELAELLCQHYPHSQIVVVGSPEERAWASRLRRLRLAPLDIRIGQTSLAELREILSEATVVVANDSGIAHIASSLEKKMTFVLTGPGDPTYIQPEGPSEMIVGPPLSCQPCERAKCLGPYGFSACLKLIEPEEVFEKVSIYLRTLESFAQ